MFKGNYSVVQGQQTIISQISYQTLKLQRVVKLDTNFKLEVKISGLESIKLTKNIDSPDTQVEK